MEGRGGQTPIVRGAVGKQDSGQVSKDEQSKRERFNVNSGPASQPTDESRVYCYGASLCPQDHSKRGTNKECLVSQSGCVSHF